ncbi:hypothetical protein N9399_03085, partial [Porticoccaceae bacterium]|nr:hypothetical protein [Porticoccaceae bacterium]
MPAGLEDVIRGAGLAIPQSGQLLLPQPLAEDLNVAVGQQVTVIVPAINGSATAAYSFLVTGIFATHTELDQILGLASLEQVGSIAGVEGLVQGFRLQVEDQFDARDTGYRLLEQL